MSKDKKYSDQDDRAAASQQDGDAAVNKETARDKFMKELATNPKCREAPKAGTGLVIGGVT